MNSEPKNPNMANCITCSEAISKNAEICPKCGEKQFVGETSGAKRKLYKLLTFIIVFFIVDVVVAILVSNGTIPINMSMAHVWDSWSGYLPAPLWKTFLAERFQISSNVVGMYVILAFLLSSILTSKYNAKRK